MIQSIDYDKLCKIYTKYFTLAYVSKDISDKFACISLTCYITNELRKRGQKVTCFDVLKKIEPNFGEVNTNGFLKPLGAICEDFMYGCTEFPTFDIPPKNIPKTLKNILDNYCPF